MNFEYLMTFKIHTILRPKSGNKYYILGLSRLQNDHALQLTKLLTSRKWQETQTIGYNGINSYSIQANE